MLLAEVLLDVRDEVLLLRDLTDEIQGAPRLGVEDNALVGREAQ